MNYITCIARFFILCIVAFNSALCARTIVLSSHGLANTYRHVFNYVKTYKKDGETHYNDKFLFPCSYASFNYPDATDRFWRVNFWQTGFGQKNEINALYAAYQKAVKWCADRNEECKIILHGVSRGASNIAILAGKYALDHVKAMIMESPYDSMDDVIENAMKSLHLEWLPLSYGQSAMESIFRKYRRNVDSPSIMIDKIQKNMPILIICSKQDTRVPYQSSINLYKKLINSGHEHAYILILDYGQHDKILCGPDGHKYQEVVHAFFKKYNLPHDPSIAARGENNFSFCRPIF